MQGGMLSKSVFSSFARETLGGSRKTCLASLSRHCSSKNKDVTLKPNVSTSSTPKECRIDIQQQEVYKTVSVKENDKVYQQQGNKIILENESANQSSPKENDTTIKEVIERAKDSGRESVTQEVTAKKVVEKSLPDSDTISFRQRLSTGMQALFTHYKILGRDVYRSSKRDLLLKPFTKVSDRIGTSTPFRKKLGSFFLRQIPENPFPEVEQPRRQEYIPISKMQLEECINDRLWMGNKPKNFGNSLHAWCYHQFQPYLSQLTQNYVRMDPEFERWTSVKDIHTWKDIVQKRETEFLKDLAAILTTANYKQIETEVLTRVLENDETDEGVSVRVDMKDYPLLQMWARGLTVKKQFVRVGWLYKFQEIYRYDQVFVVVRSKQQEEAEDIYLKLVKDVPREHLEALLPNAKPSMRTIDKIIMGTTGISALATLLYRNFMYFGSGLKSATLVSSGIFFVVCFRVYSSFVNRRTDYTLKIIKYLHYNSLANNRGALHLVVEMARVEKMKGIFLTYIFTWLIQSGQIGLLNRSHTVTTSTLFKAPSKKIPSAYEGKNFSDIVRSLDQKYDPIAIKKHGSTAVSRLKIDDSKSFKGNPVEPRIVKLIIEEFILREFNILLDFDVHKPFKLIAEMNLGKMTDQGFFQVHDINTCIKRVEGEIPRLAKDISNSGTSTPVV